MKKMMILALLTTTNVWATESRTLLKDSKVMEAELNDTTVVCSAQGYGTSELKINIKALDGFTLLDHTNLRFGNTSGLPCMTAGACKASWGHRPGEGYSVNDILNNNSRVEKIVVNREVIETRQIGVREEGDTSDDPMICERVLTENLSTVVAGIKFAHSRSTVTSERLPQSVCHF